MRFHQDSVVLRLTVVCVEWRCDQDDDATRFDPCASRTTTPSLMLNYHRCSCARVLRALPQNNPDQLPSFFSLMPRWAPSTASTWTRSTFAIGLFLARDATLRSTSTLAMALATSTRATSTRYAALGALNGRNVAIDLGLIVAIDPRHRPRLDRRPRRGRPSSARSGFVRDRLRCGATRRRGRSRRGLPTYCVDLSTVLERGRLVFFSHLRAVSSRCGRLGGFFLIAGGFNRPQRHSILRGYDRS